MAINRNISLQSLSGEITLITAQMNKSGCFFFYRSVFPTSSSDSFLLHLPLETLQRSAKIFFLTKDIFSIRLRVTTLIHSLTHSLLTQCFLWTSGELSTLNNPTRTVLYCTVLCVSTCEHEQT